MGCNEGRGGGRGFGVVQRMKQLLQIVGGSNRFEVNGWILITFLYSGTHRVETNHL